MNRTASLSALVFAIFFVGCKKEPSTAPETPASIVEQGESPVPVPDTVAVESGRKPKGLSTEDQALADAQKTCPVCGNSLADVAKPIKLTIGSRIIFADSQKCWGPIMTDPKTYFAKIDANDESQASEKELDPTPEDNVEEPQD